MNELTAGKSGSFQGKEHIWPVRVYYEDTDAAGIVYYANYLKYVERARTELLRALGIESSRLMADQGFAFAVRHLSADFQKPAKLDDLLHVRSKLLAVKGASLAADQRVQRDGEDLVVFDFRLACMGMDGNPARMPKDIQALLKKYETQ